MTKSFDQIGAFACTFVWSTQTATDCQNKIVCTNDMLCILAAQAAYQDNAYLAKLCKVQNCSTSKMFAHMTCCAS